MVAAAMTHSRAYIEDAQGDVYEPSYNTCRTCAAEWIAEDPAWEKECPECTEHQRVLEEQQERDMANLQAREWGKWPK